MAKADGSVIIDSQIDTSGINKSATDLKVQFGKMAQSAKSAAATIRTSLGTAASGMSESFGGESAKVEKILSDADKSAKSKAASIAAIYKKAGMSQSDAMKKAWEQIDRDSKHGANKVNKNVSIMTKGIISAIKRIAFYIGGAFAVGKLIQFGKEAIELGSDLAEVQNVVDVTFTTLNKQVDSFAVNAKQTAGLSQTMAKQFAGTFGAMAKSFKFSEQEAYTMSTTLTQLAGDVASFYNLSQELAFTKLKAVFTGETEGLKDLGVVMTQAALNEFAMAKGMGKTVDAMSEQEKVALRYQFVLEQLSGASGDFLRTSSGWANQTRLLALQFDELKATMGQGLINVLTPLLQMLNKAIAKLQIFAEYFRAVTAALFGDAGGGAAGAGAAYSDAAAGAEDLADGIGAAGEAAKKAERQLAGFDQITKLTAADAAGAGGGGADGAGGAIGIGPLKPPSVTGTILDDEKIQKAADVIRKIADYMPVIAGAFAGLGVGKLISNLVFADKKAEGLLGTVKLLGKKLGLIGGISLAITGITLEGKGIIDAIQTELNGVNFGKILSGGLLTTGGGALIGATFGKALLGGAIGGVVAGIPAFVVGVYDAITNGLSTLNALLIPAGATAAGAGIGAIIGSLGGPIGTGIGALIGLVIGALTDLGILIYEKWDTISAWFSEKFDWLSEGWNTFWEDVSNIASDAWQGIQDFFAPAVEWFSELGASISQTFDDVFFDIGEFGKGCWAIIKEAWNRASEWFDQNVVQPISDFFQPMWDGIVGWASEAWEGIKEVFSKVGDFFSDTFSKAWEKVVNVFSVAGEIFTDIKNAIVDSFKYIVNKLIDGINTVITYPFDGINNVIDKLKNANILGLRPFANMRYINVPQIPYLAKGGVIPPNAPFMAMLGDQKHGTNIEAPLDTIKQAVAEVLASHSNEQLSTIIEILRQILARCGISIDGREVARIVTKYQRDAARAGG